MATSKITIDYLQDQLSRIDQVTVKKMFGDYCLYISAKPVALVCDEQLFLKPTDAGRSMIKVITEGYPYPGAKPYLLITADLWEDIEWLCQLLKATADALPMPKSKKKKITTKRNNLQKDGAL